MQEKVNQWLQTLQYTLYPPTCLLCSMPGHKQLDLCYSCLQALPLCTHGCHRCGAVIINGLTECHNCIKQPLVQDSTKAIFLYQGAMPYLIKTLKFTGNYASSRILGTLMAEHFATLDKKPDLLIPVPLHPARYQQRGYNQSIELARPIAKKLHIPLALNACTRVRSTQAQAKLSAQERQCNIKGAFHMRTALQADHVAIIDDVVTTGSTVSELAKVLKQQGIRQVDVWACARAIKL